MQKYNYKNNMLWSEFFGLNRKCRHHNVPIDQDIYYCPDCGELIENQWYLVRCACCKVKEIATVRNDEVVPEENFCHNCGGKGYTLERIEKLDCININYAILIREIVKNEIKEYTQSWIDAIQTSSDIPKLLK